MEKRLCSCVVLEVTDLAKSRRQEEDHLQITASKMSRKNSQEPSCKTHLKVERDGGGAH